MTRVRTRLSVQRLRRRALVSAVAAVRDRSLLGQEDDFGDGLPFAGFGRRTGDTLFGRSARSLDPAARVRWPDGEAND